MRLLRRLLLLAVLLAAAVAGAGAWRLATMPPEALIAHAESRIAAAGMAVEVGGESQLVLWPWPGLRVGPLRGGGAGASLRLSASSALLGVSPRYLLEDLMAGRPTLGRVYLEDATLEFADPRLPEPLALTGAALVLATAPDGSLSLSGHGAIGRRAVLLAAEIAEPVALAQGGSSAVAVLLSSGDDKVRFVGDAALQPGQPMPLLDGRLTAEIGDPAALALWLTGNEQPQPALAALRAVEATATVDTAPDRLLLRGRGSAEAAGRVVGVDATVRGARDWMREGSGSAEVTIRSGGQFSASWRGTFGPGGGGMWQASGPMTVAVLDLNGVRAWLALELPGLPDGGAARLAGELHAGPGSITVEGIELHRDGETPVAGAFAYDVGAGEVHGGFGPGAQVFSPPASGPEMPAAGAETDDTGSASGAIHAGDTAPASAARGDPAATLAPVQPEAPTDGDPADETSMQATLVAAPDPAPPPAVANGERLDNFRAAPPSAGEAADLAASAELTAIPSGTDVDPRGAPLPPGMAPTPLSERRDPPTAPMPAPRTLAPALAPAGIDP